MKNKTKCFAVATAVLLTLCLVFMMPVGAEDEQIVFKEVSTYVDLQNNLTNGNSVKIMCSIDADGDFIINSGQSITIDLNGFTLSRVYNVAEQSSLFTINNGGILTIIDSSGKDGKITVTANNPDDDEEDYPKYSNNVISVLGGTLIIESGSLENLSPGGGACYVIDTYNGKIGSGCSITISGGFIYCENNDAVRIYTNSDNNCEWNLIIGKDATITTDADGHSAIWLWLTSNKATSSKVNLNIDGATLNGDYSIDSSSGGSSVENVMITIKDGTFNGHISLSGDPFNKGINGVEKLTINGGSFKGTIVSAAGSDKAKNTISITGGSFTDPTVLNYLDENADVTVNLDDEITISNPITISKKATVSIVGTGEEKSTITYSDTNRAINILGEGAQVTLTNLNIAAASAERGVNVGAANVVLNIDGCDITAKYPININDNGDNVMITATKSELDATVVKGYTAINNWGVDCTFTFNDCTLIGKNTYGAADGWNSFGVVVLNEDATATVTLNDCTIEASVTDGSDDQYVFDVRNSGSSVIVKGDKTVVTYPRGDLIGRFLNGAEPAGIMSVEAGTFSFAVPAEYIAVGYTCVENNGKFNVVPKDYTIEASVAKVGFDSVKVGYSAVDAQEVTVTNKGNVPMTFNADTASENYVVTVVNSENGDSAKITIKPVDNLPVGNYEDTLTITIDGTEESLSIPVSFLVYQPSSGGSSKPVEEPVEPEIPEEPEVPTEEPVAGEVTVETEVTDGGEVEFEAPVEEPGVEGGSAAADEDEAKITGVVLPTGTDSEVTFVPISEQAAPEGKETQTKKVFEINVPTYEKGKAAVIKFTMTVAELAADGKEAADVALWHFDEETGEWTKLVTSYTIVDGVVYFEAITNDFSPFAIVYEDEPVNEPVEEPETPASPAPVLGLIAALGAAVVLRRK